MTKSRLVYILVLLIASLALIWDKTRSGGPSTGPSEAQAHRSPVVVDDFSVERPSADTVSSPSSSDGLLGSVVPLAQGLSSLLGFSSSSQGDISSRDIFNASSVFLQSTGLGDPSADGFVSADDLRLSTIMIGSTASYAMINDQVVSIGDSVGSFRVSAISFDSVSFESGGEIFVLSLMDSSMAAPSAPSVPSVPSAPSGRSAVLPSDVRQPFGF